MLLTVQGITNKRERTLLNLNMYIHLTAIILCFFGMVICLDSGARCKWFDMV